ncbi:hypothetical protein HMSSN036_32210 [Paenibacillus macerans]|nr:hypothetical protein HMSSN036_32210 [Paenibacillus macerans]
MVDAGLIAVEKQGRHRYYGIRNPEVAQVMESLLSIAPPVKIKSLRQSAEEQALRKARTCYDHLAGSLGVSLTQSLVREGILLEGENGFEVTKNGEAFFENFQIDLNRVKKKNAAHFPTNAWIGANGVIIWPERWATPCWIGCWS